MNYIFSRLPLSLILVVILGIHLNELTLVSTNNHEVINAPPPTVVLLYPEFLKNGSSFAPRDFIFFTLTGDLSHLDDEKWDWSEANYQVRYHWDGENYNEGMYEGEIWNVTHPNAPVWHRTFVSTNYLVQIIDPMREFGYPPIWDTWHNLTFVSDLLVSDTLIRGVNTQKFFFYANRSQFLPSEPLGVTPLIWPNNSILPPLFDPWSELAFLASGYRYKDNITYGTIYPVPSKYPVKVYYSWDNNSGPFLPPSSLRSGEYMCDNIIDSTPPYAVGDLDFNLFKIEKSSIPRNPLNNRVQTGWQDLYIKIENDTSTETFHFRYFITDLLEQFPLQISKEQFFHPYYWGPGEDPFRISYSINFRSMHSDQIIKKTLLNWNDGTGNHTLTITDGEDSEITIEIPQLAFNQSEPTYMTFWVEMENRSWFQTEPYPLYWISLRIPYQFVNIEPQVNLMYPINDFPKAGIIPIIWNLKSNGIGAWNFSQYHFDVTYETDTGLNGTVVKDYQKNDKPGWRGGLIDIPDENTFGKRLTYFRNQLNYYERGSDPAIYVVPFNITKIFEEDESVSNIQFKIHETTTNKVINSTSIHFSFKVSQVSQAPKIHSATTDWILITNELFKFSLPRQSSTNMSLIWGITGIIVIISGRRKQHNR